MRFERLDLTRFGKFTDCRLEFPAHGTDFHFIVGPNEAGKSTIRAAITDLLFGIESQSVYDFVHGYSDMRLGAAIRHGDSQLEFSRVKRAKNPLRDLEDNPLKDDLLVPFLAGMDRRSFERMFCLDHEQLLQGGSDILNAKDDVARMLFEASSGITGFGGLRDALEAEAKTLWDKRRSGDRRFYRAADELRAAEDLLKQATVRAKDWVELEQRLQEARERSIAARRTLESLEMRRTRLERIRRVAPHLQKLHADTQAHDRLSDAARLSRNAREDLERAQKEIAAAETLWAKAERDRLETERRMREIQPDDACLKLASQIRSLTEQRVRTQQFARTIEARRTELRMKLEEAQRLARQLGWEGDPDALERMLPPQTLRAALQELLQEHGQLTEAVAAASQALTDKQLELDTLALRLERVAEQTVPPGLRSALQAARNLPERHLQEMRARAQQAQGRMERTFQGLHPWQGLIEALRTLVLPAEAEAREHQTAEQALSGRLQMARDERGRIAGELASQRLKVEQLRQARAWVTQDHVRHARRERDELWQSLRTGIVPLRENAQVFEGRVEEADRVADLRYAGAADTAVLEQLTAAVTQHELKLSQQEQAIAALESSIEAHRATWIDRLRPLGLANLSAPQFLDWSRRRDAVLQMSEEAAASSAELQRSLATVERAKSELSSQLETCGESVSSDAELAQLIALADAVIRRIEESQTRRATLLEQQQNANATWQALRTRAERSQADMYRWEKAWADQLSRARLPADSGRLAVSQALNLFSELAIALKEARDLQRNQIDVMQRELDAFAESAAQLSERSITISPSTLSAVEVWAAAAPRGAKRSAQAGNLLRANRRAQAGLQADAFEVQPEPGSAVQVDAFAMQSEPRSMAQTGLPPEQRSQELERRLAEAVGAANALEALRTQLRDRNTEIDQARQRREQAEATIHPLMAQCGTRSLDELRVAIDRSEALHKAEVALEASRSTCLQSGDGLTIEQLESEAASEDVNAIPSQLTQIAGDLARLADAQNETVRVITECEQGLRRYAGQADAASAEALRQEALAEMAATIERYVKVTIAARMLRWSIDRYREDKQAPLLRRASQVFSTLTRGSFERLTVDFDDRAPALKGSRPDGALVDVAGMSDGTRDQLFLALRVAALELQLAQGRALPFVADDLFINFDDARSTAGFEALAELATHTQVIFLTHHSHLLPLVERALGQPINVVTL